MKKNDTKQKSDSIKSDADHRKLVVQALEDKKNALVEDIDEILTRLDTLNDCDVADVAIRVIASYDIVGLGHLLRKIAEKVSEDLVAATPPSPGETAVLATPTSTRTRIRPCGVWLSISATRPAECISRT